MDVVVDHAAHIWAELRIVREYTKAQTETLLRLRDIYIACFDSSHDAVQSDTVFAMDKDMKAPTITKQMCDEKLKTLLRRVLADNPLTPFVNDIVVTVQEYYRLRHTGMRRVHFYVNDPRSLLCIHLLQFVQDVLKGDRSMETIEAIQRWVKFFKQVRIQNVFPVRESSTSAADTLYSMLVNIERKLQAIVEYIHAEIKERSIGDHLDQLVMVGRNVVDTLFVYLGHVMSGQPTPILSVGSFHNTIMATALQDWMADNHHAHMLSSLASQKAVVRLLGVLPNTTDVSSSSSTTFLTRDCLPGDDDIRTFLSSKNTAHFLKSKRDIAACVLRTFGNVNVLSELLLVCKEAAFLAKMVGEIMLCWNEVASKILSALMTTVKEVVRIIKTDMSYVCKDLQAMHMYLTQKLGKVEDEEVWKVNYRVVTQMESVILESDKLGKMDSLCFAVQQHLAHPEARMIETRERLDIFIASVQDIFGRMKWLPNSTELLRLTDAFTLDIPFPPRTSLLEPPTSASRATGGESVCSPSSRSHRLIDATPPRCDALSDTIRSCTPPPKPFDVGSAGDQESFDSSGDDVPTTVGLSPTQDLSFNQDPQFQRVPDLDLPDTVAASYEQWLFTTVGHLVALSTFKNRCADVLVFKRSDGSRVGTLRAGERSLQTLVWLNESLLCASDDQATYVWDIVKMNLQFMAKGISQVNLNHQLHVYSKPDGARHCASLFNTRTLTANAVGPSFTWNTKTATIPTVFDHSPNSAYVLTSGLLPRVHLGDNIVHWQQTFCIWDQGTQGYEPMYITPVIRGDRVVDARFISGQFFYLQWSKLLQIFDRTTGLEWYIKMTSVPIFKVFVVQQWLVAVEAPIGDDRMASATNETGPNNYTKVWLIDVAKKKEVPVPFPAQYVAVECTMDGKLLVLLKSGKFVLFPLF
eukprot:PhM_4_TR4468/c0_g1_i1/m.92809